MRSNGKKVKGKAHRLERKYLMQKCRAIFFAIIFVRMQIMSIIVKIEGVVLNPRLPK
jgi:hypothetical protein